MYANHRRERVDFEMGGGEDMVPMSLGDGAEPKARSRTQTWDRLIRGALVATIALLLFLGFTSFFRKPDGERRHIAPGVPLRILPLGDSITFGEASNDGNGYRKALFDTLTRGGSHVTYIGSKQAGNMRDNHHEGWSGYTIQHIAEVCKPTLKQQPNVILLHVGTNDMHHNPPPEPVATAPERMSKFIDQLTQAVPEAVIIVAQVISSDRMGTKDRIPALNTAISTMVSEKKAKGAKTILVDMSDIGIDGSYLADGLHPNDIGYQKMAERWMDGLSRASDRHWIKPPPPLVIS